MLTDFLPKQKIALEHLRVSSPVTELLYGGAKGSAKSVLGCRWQIERRLKYPGSKSIIGRSSLRELKKSTMPTLFEWLGKYGLVARRDYTYNGQDLFITFSNGSEIHFFDLFDYPSDPDFQRFGGIEVMDVFVDEAAEVSYKCVSILKTLCRKGLKDWCPHCYHHDTTPKLMDEWNCVNCGKLTTGLPVKLLMTCNPAKGWLYEKFYLPNKEGYLPELRAYVAALPDDNPYLSKEYIDELDNLPEYDKQRLRYGNWEYDDSEGKMFETFDLIAMFRQMNIDGQEYITADIAGDGTDKTIIIRWQGMTAVEIHEFRRMPVDEIATFIRKLIEDHKVPLRNIIADYDGIGKGVADILKCVGFVNGSKARDPKYQHLKAECYYKLASVVKENGITFVGDATKPKAEIIKQLEHIKRHRPNADGKFNVTPKEDLKRSLGYSPDYADAIMMRMYFLLGQGTGKYVFG